MYQAADALIHGRRFAVIPPVPIVDARH
jgi:hypothetical protein